MLNYNIIIVAYRIPWSMIPNGYTARRGNQPGTPEVAHASLAAHAPRRAISMQRATQQETIDRKYLANTAVNCLLSVVYNLTNINNHL